MLPGSNRHLSDPDPAVEGRVGLDGAVLRLLKARRNERAMFGVS
jgi:hypothetical protein